ncbi:conserved hypothetical protein [Xenorhabdus bovienii str. kraussei Quebec]|uniref:Uncharacterized protein n=1 Tax=Xenorhabdus bovienii str. kraussei Quebec TaxID=1398203 RepID=A0A077PEP3_XENBV|nr:conserved hypothetical protein [Xenorhabdus bovienii str. kraussei Quebec]
MTLLYSIKEGKGLLLFFTIYIIMGFNFSFLNKIYAISKLKAEIKLYLHHIITNFQYKYPFSDLPQRIA